MTYSKVSQFLVALGCKGLRTILANLFYAGFWQEFSKILRDPRLHKGGGVVRPALRRILAPLSCAIVTVF